MNKRFQDSFTSRVQLESLRFFSLVGWRPISPPALIYKPSPARIRFASSRCGLAPNKSRKKEVRNDE